MKIPASWKLTLNRLMQRPLLGRLMVLGIRLTVPRQRIGVALVAIDERERVLLLHHVFHPYTPWGLPGGWLKRNEDPEVGVLRELREETGLTAVIEIPLFIKQGPNPPHLEIIFLGRIQEGPITLSSEIIDAAWFSLDELPQPMLPFMRKSIDRAINIRRGQKTTLLPGKHSHQNSQLAKESDEHRE